jgi:glycerol-3-phosphate dehydrogenase
VGIKKNSKISGIRVQNVETGEDFDVQAKAVVNATGVFTDSLRLMDDPGTKPIIQVSQGVHIVLDRHFQPGKSAIMIPKTADGRVMLAVPWHNKVIVGTTDTPVKNAELEPFAFQQELDFLLSHTAKYLTEDPEPEDVKSVFTGLRPLVKESGSSSTKKISRDHTILVDRSGLVTITGGKWTTYRKMAEDTVDHASEVAGLEQRKAITADLKIHGWTSEPVQNGRYDIYGADRDAIQSIESENDRWGDPMHPHLPYRPAEVVWAVRNEQARSVEDILSRRTRAILLDAKASMEIADTVADLIAAELNFDEQWKKTQVSNFKSLAEHYLIKT